MRLVPDVCIIGAGVSGAVAARRLAEDGVLGGRAGTG